MDKKYIIGYLEIVFAVVVWGTSFIATKVALRDLVPITVVWIRFAIGVLVLGMVALSRRQLHLPNKRNYVDYALLGFLGITFHQWLQSNGLVTSQASTTAWIVATTPVFIAILSWLFLREKISLIQSAGILLAIVGVLLIVSKGNQSSILKGNFGSPGDILILISAINWAVFSIISKYKLQDQPATQMMFYVISFGWIFSSLLFFIGNNFQDLHNITLKSFLAVMFLGVFCSGLAYIAWYDGLKLIPASKVGVFLFIEPVIAVYFSWLVLHETFFISMVIGGILIVLGVSLVQWKEKILSKNS